MLFTPSDEAPPADHGLEGRTRELALFRETLHGTKPHRFLYLMGPAGIGKTTLIDTFEREALSFGWRVLRLCGDELAPDRGTVIDALTEALSPTPARQVTNALAQTGAHTLLLLDHFDALFPLDDWFRERFFPTLPPSLVVCFAGRRRLNARWWADAGWRTLLKILPISPFDAHESAAFLAARSIAQDHHKSLHLISGGHPLTLSLLVERAKQPAFRPSRLVAYPEINRKLVNEIMAKVPGEAYGWALECAAMVPHLTEDLLAEMLGRENSAELFGWLSHESCIKVEPDGLVLPGLIRDTLLWSLQREFPRRYGELLKKAREYYFFRLLGPSSQERSNRSRGLQHLLIHYRFSWQNLDQELALHIEESATLKPEDWQDIQVMVHDLEGPESLKMLQYWRANRAGFVVARDESDRVAGFYMLLRLDEISRDVAARDPGVRGIHEYVGSLARHPGESLSHLCRFWMTRQQYQDLTGVRAQLFSTLISHWMNLPGRSLGLIILHQNADRIVTTMRRVFDHYPSGDFELEGNTFYCYGNDFSHRTVPEFLNASITELTAAFPPNAGENGALMEDEFKDEVGNALHGLHRIDNLRHNKLLNSGLVSSKLAHNATTDERVRILKELLSLEAAGLKETRRDESISRVVDATFFNPAGKALEVTAQDLRIPYGTCRRHQQTAVERIATSLWEKECQLRAKTSD